MSKSCLNHVFFMSFSCLFRDLQNDANGPYIKYSCWTSISWWHLYCRYPPSDYNVSLSKLLEPYKWMFLSLLCGTVHHVHDKLPSRNLLVSRISEKYNLNYFWITFNFFIHKKKEKLLFIKNIFYLSIKFSKENGIL